MINFIAYDTRATRFFRFFCHDHFYEELQGDLEETFQSNLEAHGPAYARKVYWKEVVLLLRPSVIKKLDLFAPFKFSPDMIQNYIKIAFRNFFRHKIFSS